MNQTKSAHLRWKKKASCKLLWLFKFMHYPFPNDFLPLLWRSLKLPIRKWPSISFMSEKKCWKFLFGTIIKENKWVLLLALYYILFVSISLFFYLTLYCTLAEQKERSCIPFILFHLFRCKLAGCKFLHHQIIKDHSYSYYFYLIIFLSEQLNMYFWNGEQADTGRSELLF